MNSEIELPGYTIIEEIGKGGMSNVYYAHQHNFDMNVALKIMDTSLLRNPEFGVRFIEEARTMKRLHHNHVVAVNDVGQHGNYYYLSMEYLEGGDLKAKIKSGVKVDEAIKVVNEIASALDYIHRRGFVHRDIKPENVLFRSDGTAVLTDFGIARAVEGSNHLTKTGMVIGTPNYMSPEQAKGQTVDFRSDIYSLGVLLFELLTGELPYKGDSSVSVGIKHITQPVPELGKKVQRFQPVVNRAMAKTPEERYGSCGEMMADLDKARNGELTEDETVWIPQQTTPQRSDSIASKPFTAEPPRIKWPVKKGLAAAALLLVAAVGGYLFWPDQRQPEVGSLISEQVRDESLAAATRYIETDQLTEAEASYRTVLALDTGNEEAIDGLESIGETYLQRARQELEAENYSETSKLLADVLRVFPDHPDLKDVQTELLDVQYEKSEQQRLAREQADFVARTLQMAEAALAEGRILKPPGDNALDHFHRVLTVDVQNEEARAGIESIALRFLKNAEVDIENGEFQQARSSILLAIQIAPDIEQIGAVQSKLERGQAALEKSREEEARKERQRREIIALSEAADQDLLQGRLVAPEGNNAYEKYQKILLLDNSNAVAQRGVNQIAGQLMQMAVAAAESGEFEESDGYFSRAVSIAPGLQGSDEYQSRIRRAKLDFQRLESSRKQMQALLKEAEGSVSSGQLFLPAEQSAYRKYMAVLELDADNPEAKKGLENIGLLQIKQVNLLIDEDDLDGAASALEKLIANLPKQPGIATTQIRLEERRRVVAEAARKQQQAADRQARIARLLKEADADLVDDYLRRAYAKFAEVLSLDEGNKRAVSGVEKINNRYLELIRFSLERGNFDVVDVYLNGLRETGTQSRAYRTAVAEINSARVAHEEQQRAERAREEGQREQVENLLAEARRQMQADNLMGSGDDNAFAHYRKALDMDAQSREALDGIDQIYASVFARIDKLAAAKQFDEAESVLAEITRLNPSDPRIAPQRLSLSKAKADHFEQTTKQRLIDSKLERADNLLKSTRLNHSMLVRAEDLYNDVLELDAGNRKARESRALLIDAYSRVIGDRISNNDVRSARELVDKALQEYGDDKQLLSLQAKISRLSADSKQLVPSF